MKSTIESKAMQLIRNGKVKLVGELKERNIYVWEVGSGTKVIVKEIRNEKGTYFTCSCKYCGSRGPNAGICTYVASVIAYRVLGVKQEVKNEN